MASYKLEIGFVFLYPLTLRILKPFLQKEVTRSLCLSNMEVYVCFHLKSFSATWSPT